MIPTESSTSPPGEDSWWDTSWRLPIGSSRSLIFYAWLWHQASDGRGWAATFGIHLRKRLRVSLPPRVQYRVYETDLTTQLWLHRQGFLCRGTEKHDDGRPDVYVFCYHAPAYTEGDVKHDERV
jgi:hypothetical protein